MSGCRHRFVALVGGIACEYCGLQVAIDENAPWVQGTPKMSGWYEVEWESGDGPQVILVTVIANSGVVWSYGEGDDPALFPGPDTPNPQWRFVCFGDATYAGSGVSNICVCSHPRTAHDGAAPLRVCSMCLCVEFLGVPVRDRDLFARETKQ